MTDKGKGTGRKRQSRSVEGVPTIDVDSVLDQLDNDSTETEYHYRWVELGDFLTRAEFERLKRVRPDIRKRLKPREVKKKIPKAVTQRNRDQLAMFLYDCIPRLYDLALREQDTPAKRWAGQTLGKVIVWLNKHDKKLSANPWYKEAKSKTGKLKELQAPSLIRQIMLEETNKALRYWWVMQINPAAKIPEEYRCLRRLKSFPEEEEKWFKQCLWPQIKKRKSKLLPQLRKLAPQNTYLKDFYGQFRDVSQSLAETMMRSFRFTTAGTLQGEDTA